MSQAVTVVHADQAAVQSFAWGTLRWLCNAELAAESQQTFGLSEIFPGQRNPLHYHPNCEEILHVVQGECDHSHDGQWTRLSAGSTIVIPAGVRHNLINRGLTSVICMISFSSPHRETVFLEGE